MATPVRLGQQWKPLKAVEAKPGAADALAGVLGQLTGALEQIREELYAKVMDEVESQIGTLRDDLTKTFITEFRALLSTVKQPVVHVTVPQQAAPDIHVQVDVPEQPAPTVTVTAAPTQVVVKEPSRRRIIYDADGRPVALEESR